MSTLLDIVSAVVIAGIIFLLIMNIQATMLESNVENRMMQDLQGMADVTISFIQEEIKRLTEFEEITDSTIRFKNTNNDVITFERVDNALRSYRIFPDDSTPVERFDNVYLRMLRFETVSLPGAPHALLRIRVLCEIENTVDQSATIIAYAQRDVFLRNFYLPRKN